MRGLERGDCLHSAHSATLPTWPPRPEPAVDCRDAYHRGVRCKTKQKSMHWQVRVVKWQGSCRHAAPERSICRNLHASLLTERDALVLSYGKPPSRFRAAPCRPIKQASTFWRIQVREACFTCYVIATLSSRIHLYPDDHTVLLSRLVMKLCLGNVCPGLQKTLPA